MQFQLWSNNGPAHLILTTATGLILALPAIIFGFPAYTHDGWIHALWMTNFSDQLWSGDLYPRWLANLNGGAGSPSFFFYPPIPYYLSSLLKPFFAGDEQGWLRLGLMASLALIASGWSAYFWLKEIAGRSAACVAAILYVVAPYHTIADLYIRGAFAELFTLVWTPLILYFAHRIKADDRRATTGLALGYALLIASHLPTALIFSPLPLGYAFFTATPKERKKKTLITLSAMALGLGLSAIYLLPAITMREFVSMHEMKRSDLLFDNWFLFVGDLSRGFRAHLIWIAASSLVLAICAFFVSSFDRDEQARRERAFWMCVALIAAFVMTPLSQPVWRALPLLQNIQFPFRFNTILTLAASALFALGFHLLNNSNTGIRVCRAILALTALLWLIATPMFAWRQYAIYHQFSAPRSQSVANNLDAFEYRPRWVDRDSFIKQAAAASQTRLEASRIDIVEGEAEASVEVWKPGEITLKIASKSGATFDVRQYFFPNWRARAIATGNQVDALPAPVSGFLRIAAPSGSHRIELRLVPMIAELAGQTISALSLALALLLALRFGWRSNSAHG
jgi:hypothetical protein